MSPRTAPDRSVTINVMWLTKLSLRFARHPWSFCGRPGTLAATRPKGSSGQGAALQLVVLCCSVAAARG